MILADKIFYNGNVYTMEGEGELVSALVVHGGKIVYAGSDEEALKYPAVDGGKIDLNGRTVLPGFSDTHIHLAEDCILKSWIHLGEATSIDEVIEVMKKGAAEGRGVQGDWIMAMGIFPDKMKEKRFPNRKELDRVSETRPIYIDSHCGHIKMLNSKAFSLANVPNKDIKFDEEVDYFEDGEPNGVFRESSYGRYFAENAASAEWGKLAFRLAALKAGLPDYSKVGLTSLHAIATMPEDTPIEQFNQYYELEKQGLLPQRIHIMPSDYLPWTASPTTGFGTEMVKLAGRKIFLDGSLGAHTAAMLEPFSDDPGNKGIMTQTREGLEKQFREGVEHGLDIGIHVIGDAAMELVLDVAEKVYPQIDEPDPRLRLKKAKSRLRVIHATMANDGQIARIKRLPIILEMQPYFLHSDVDIALPRLGHERMAAFTPLKKFHDNGILMTGGSDASVDPAVPLNGIQCAVTRQSLDGRPEGGLEPADEVLSVYQAVELYTCNAAYCSGEEDVKGTLSAGKYADLVVLGRDIFKTPPHEISKIEVLATYVGGRNTWKSP